MGYLLDVILCGGVLLLELIGVFVIAMLAQGIIYWFTGFSVYNYSIKKLKKLTEEVG